MSIEREQWNKLWSEVNRDFMLACVTLHQEKGIMFIYLGNKAPSTSINSFNYKWSWCTSILWKCNYHGLLHRYENWVNLELKPFWRLCWMKPDIQPLIGYTLRERAADFLFFSHWFNTGLLVILSFFPDSKTNFKKGLTIGLAAIFVFIASPCPLCPLHFTPLRD